MVGYAPLSINDGRKRFTGANPPYDGNQRYAGSAFSTSLTQYDVPIGITSSLKL
jgi:hypothetical protein